MGHVVYKLHCKIISVSVFTMFNNEQDPQEAALEEEEVLLLAMASQDEFLPTLPNTIERDWTRSSYDWTRLSYDLHTTEHDFQLGLIRVNSCYSC